MTDYQAALKARYARIAKLQGKVAEAANTSKTEEALNAGTPRPVTARGCLWP